MQAMFSFTIRCSVNDMYPTPFSLPAGTYFVEASSVDSRTMVVLSVPDPKKEGRSSQSTLSETVGESGERILIVYVPQGGELPGMRVLRYVPGAEGGDPRDVLVTCCSPRSLFAELQELRVELAELRAAKDNNVCPR